MNSKLTQVKVGDFLELITDYHSNGSYENLKKNVKLLEKKNFAIMIRTLNFERNDFSKDLIYVDEKAYNFLKKSVVRPNDILMNKIANAGSIYIMPDLQQPVTCGMNLFLIRFNSKVNQRYMYYNIKNSEQNIKNLIHGTTTTTITKDEVRDITLNIHNLEEQNKIEKVLSALDYKIDNNNKINTELESMAETIYDFWFLQFEFPNEEGKPYKSSGGKMVWNNELQQEIPEKGIALTIGNIITENQKSSIQVGDVNEFNGSVPFFTSGDSILNTDIALVDGRNCFLNTGGNADVKFYVGEASYSTDTWCITADGTTDYLYLILNGMMPQFDQKFFQGTGLKHLQKPLFKNTYIYLPDKEILSRFNKEIHPLFDTISANTQENQRLISLRDFLLPLLMNGQVGFKKDGDE